MKGRTLLKGIGIGMMAGAILTAAAVPMDKKKMMRSGAGRTIRAIGHMMDNLT